VRFNAAVLLVEPDAFYDCIECLSDYLGLPHAESVGQSDENSSEQESPAVSPEEFFEIREQVFHVLPEWPVQAGERKKSVFTKEISSN
jgi:hypothetical protein